jgi:osmoprotectant transport system permease protein
MTWVLSNFSQIWRLTLDHIALSVPPILLGFLIAVPLGWVAHRYKPTRGVLLTVGGLLYTIPGIALFLSLPPILGTRILDPINVIVGMTIYAVALLVRTAADAFDAVSSDVRQSSVAVGYGPVRRFFEVELPLAGPVLLSGLRVVSASTVSLVSIGSLIGVSSLGYFFLNGLNRRFPTEIFTGIVGVIVIAVVFDLLLVLLGRLVLPWAHVARTRERRGRRVAA